MAHYNFVKDIKESEILALYKLNHFLFNYPKAYLKSGYYPGYDMWLDEKNTAEFKFDMESMKTGNIAIEICKPNGNPSGILATTSNIWIHYAAGEILYFEPKKLKEYCKVGINENTKKPFRLLKGGDNKATYMIIIPISQIKEDKIYSHLEPCDELRNYVLEVRKHNQEEQKNITEIYINILINKIIKNHNRMPYENINS
jgi:hypothetical protein